MASDKGFTSRERNISNQLPQQDHVTAQPVGEKYWAKDVVAHIALTSEGSSTAEAGSTASAITSTAHSVKVGDLIKFTSGSLLGSEAKVTRVIDANSFELGSNLSEAPAAGDSYDIFRNTSLRATSDGSLEVSAVQTPIKFRLDGSEQEVTEDTVTPSNNAPLPVKLTSASGDINITAGDLNVQTSHSGATFDSMRIGDGTETVEINASGEMQVRDDDANTALSSIDSKDFATQTTLAALLTELELKADLSETQPVSISSLPLPADAATESTLSSILTELEAKADLTETQPVSAAALPLPTGAATEATLLSLDGKDFATQTTLAALLTELQAKADLTETQPVSAASLPLPSGAATEATLSSIDSKDFATQTTLAALLTELQAKADLAETQPVSLATIPLATGASTEAKQDSIITELQSLVSQTTGLDILEFAKHDYVSTNVTTGAQVSVTTLSNDIKEVDIFDSSGQDIFLKVNGSNKMYISPGGNGKVPFIASSGDTIEIQAASDTADAGFLLINFIG